MKKLMIIGLIVLARSGGAQILAPSAVEVRLHYTASFVTDDMKSTRKDAAAFHASHLFGILQSEEFIRGSGVDPELTAGVGVPYLPQDIEIISAKNVDAGREIKYELTGQALIEKTVAQSWLNAGHVTLPLPSDLTQIYDKRCTDGHYSSEGDYWYFYDPFRERCRYLLAAPYAQDVEVEITPVEAAYAAPAHLELLRRDDGDKKEIAIYVIHGFSDSAKQRGDEGRKGFKDFNEFLLGEGFEESVERRDPRRPLYVFEKDAVDAQGRSLHIVVQSLLVETGIESRGVTFAKFFREAVENADVLLYAGHSGLGGNLDIPSLEQKAGKFKIDPVKEQVFFFDSCSSYSYYLDEFKSRKNSPRLAIITNGLQSEFEASEKVHEAFMDEMIAPEPDADWPTILRKLEAPLGGGSYLINVGGG